MLSLLFSATGKGDITKNYIPEPLLNGLFTGLCAIL
jgi:hypothetical protein